MTWLQNATGWRMAPLALAVGLVLFLLSQLAHFLSTPELLLAVVWPVSGVLMAVLARLPFARWWSVLLAAGVANMLSGAGVQGHDFWMVLGFTVANLVESSVGAYLLQRVARGPFSLRRPADIGWFLVFGVLLCPMVGATIGAAVGSAVTGEAFFPLWQLWWASDAAGIAMFAPVALLFITREERLKVNLFRIVEGVTLSVLLLSVSVVAFGAIPVHGHTPLRFPMFGLPLLGWAGLRFGRRGASLASLCFTLFACWAVIRATSWYSFLELPLDTRLSVVHVFCVIGSLMPLYLSTVLDAQRQSDRRFRALVSNSPVVVFETDTAGRCTFANERFTQLTGKPREAALGYEWISSVHPEDRDRVVSTWLSATFQRQEEIELECRYFGVDNKVHWVIANAIAIHADDGTVTGYLGTILDISDRRETELRLEEAYADLERRVEERTAELTEANAQLRHEIAERIRAEEQLQQQQSQLAHVSRLNTIGQMAAGLAHEVNQPLYAISNYTRGLLMRLETGERPTSELCETLSTVASEAERAGEILRRIRSFVRPQSTGRKQVSLNQLVHDVVRLTAFEARQRGVTIGLSLSEESLEVLCDPIQIQQVLVNLVRNGFEAMEGLPVDERRVTIETFANDGEAGCAVCDSGHSVPPDHCERIFDPFFSTKSQGLGMGLPISRSLVESFAGRLWFEPRLGKGATFRFTLPRVAPEELGKHERYRSDRISG